MQFTIASLTLFLAATAAAMPAMQAPSEPLARRQSGTVGLGGACQSRDDCIGDLSCIFGGGQQICSRNRGQGQPCAVDAVSLSFRSPLVFFSR